MIKSNASNTNNRSIQVHIDAAMFSQSSSQLILTDEEQRANEKYTDHIEHVSKTILFYGCITIIPIGLIFNVLMIVIFLRKRFHNTNMGYYYIVSVCAAFHLELCPVKLFFLLLL